MRNAYPAYTAGAAAGGGFTPPVLSTGTYELILISDLGVSSTVLDVDTWTDQSSNAYVATGAGAARPVIDGTDGTKQTLRWGAGDVMTIPNFVLSTSFTMFVRADPDQATTWGVHVGHGNSIGANNGMFFNMDKPHNDANFGGIRRGGTLGLREMAYTEFHETRGLWVLGYKASDQTWVMKQDGVDLTQTGQSGTMTNAETEVTDTLYIGLNGTGVSSGAWKSAIVICEGALSGAEITSVSNAINAYFA